MQFGEVVDCVIVSEKETKKSRGFGFVQFTKCQTVEDIVDKRYYEIKINNKWVECKRALPKETCAELSKKNPKFNKNPKQHQNDPNSLPMPTDLYKAKDENKENFKQEGYANGYHNPMGYGNSHLPMPKQEAGYEVTQNLTQMMQQMPMYREYGNQMPQAMSPSMAGYHQGIDEQNYYQQTEQAGVGHQQLPQDMRYSGQVPMGYYREQEQDQRQHIAQDGYLGTYEDTYNQREFAQHKNEPEQGWPDKPANIKINDEQINTIGKVLGLFSAQKAGAGTILSKWWGIQTLLNKFL